MGALLLALVAAMTPFVAGPDLAYAQSAQITLYELSLAEQGADPPTVSAFMPKFIPDGAPAEDGYTAYAASSVSTVALTATKSHSGASVAVKVGATEEAAMTDTPENDSSPYTVTLLGSEGDDTVILVTVTAADNIAMATYKLTVMRGAIGSGVVTLSALSLMAGGEKIDISPDDDPFDSTENEYTARVPNATTMVEVMATPTDARDGATYAVTSKNEDDEDNTVQNGVVSLSEGDNTITVTVTAADKVSTDTYTVTVTRVESNISSATTLAALSIVDGASPPAAVSLRPAFRSGSAPASGGYTAEVAHTVANVTLTATARHAQASVEVKKAATEKAAMEDATAINPTGNNYTVALEAEGTDTVILVTVTAEDDASKATYKVTVEEGSDPASSTATLSALSITAGGDELELMPEFATTTTDPYMASVPYAVSRATVMATTTNRGAIYAVTSVQDSSVQNNRIVDLSEGDNVITVTVTPTDRTAAVATFTVTVKRAKSTDARVTTLAALSLVEQGADPQTVSGFMPLFAPEDAPAPGGYSAYAVAATSVDTVRLTATASHTGANVEVEAGADEESASADAVSGSTSPYTVTLQAAGDDTVILVTVTGADGFATSTYKLTVMRGAANSNVVTLSALSLMAGGEKIAFDTAFIANDISENTYTARVPNATTMVEVMVTPTDARDGATYAVKSDKDSSVQNGVVDLPEGANVITVTVTGADKVSTGEYTVTVTRVESTLSDDTTLSTLSLVDTGDTNPVDLDPEFVPNSRPVEGGYSAEIGATIDSVVVTSTVAHTGASIEVRAGADEAAAMEADAITEVSGTYTVDEAAGFQGQGADTVILITVTAADLTTTGTHKITVSREAEAINSELKALRLGDVALTLDNTENAVHRAIVEVPSVTVMATPRNSMATVKVESDKDSDVEDYVVDLEVGINVITVTVDPVAPTTMEREYTIRVRRNLSDDATLSSLSLKHLPMNMMAGESIDLTPAFASGVMTYNADAGDAEEITATAVSTHLEADVSVTVDGAMADMVDVESHWNMLGCPAMNDAVGADDQPDDPTSPYCRMYDGLDEDPKMKVDEAYKYHYSVSLMEGENTVEVMVTAEDGTATETYTVMVTVGMVTLLDRYDADESGHIDLSEVNKAIDDYFDDLISLANVNTVIDLYFE